MSSSLERLLQNLYAALNRDPQAVPAFSLTFTPLAGAVPSSYWLRVGDDTLTGTCQVTQQPQGPADPAGALPSPHQNLNLDLRAIPKVTGFTGTPNSISHLIAYLNTLPGFAATLLDPNQAPISASALIDGVQDVVAGSTVSVTTSLLWALFKPIAWLLRRAQNEVDATIGALGPGTAQGMWLSTLGDLYGFDRMVGESDDQYRTRLLYAVIKPRANNIAMEEFLRYSLALATVSVTDVPLVNGIPTPFHFAVTLTIAPGAGFVVNSPRIHALVDSIKAWGVIWDLIIRTLDTEIIPIELLSTESQAFRIAPTPEQFNLSLVAEKLAAKIVQRYSDTARASALYLYTNRWKNGLGAVISDTNDPNVILLAPGAHYRSFIASIVDIWRSLPYASPLPNETWSTIANVADTMVYRMKLQPEDASAVIPTEQVQTALRAALADQPGARWRVLWTNRRANLTNDLNSLVSATWPPPGRFAVSVGDPSWTVVKH